MTPTRQRLLLLCLLWLGAAGLARGYDSGVVLIADPGMRSSIFSHSVVLVTPHGRGAAIGVILNQPIPVEPANLYPEDSLLQQLDEVYFGGPVAAGSVAFLFRSTDPPDNAVHLFADVYFSGDRDVLAEQLRRPQKESGLQVYIGYSGWAPGQLQMEIMHGDWLTREADVELLFETERESIWKKLSEEQDEISI